MLLYFSSPNSKALLEKLTAEFIAKSDRYDVIAVSSPWVSAFGRYVRPLDELISEKGVDKSKFGTILNQAFYEKKVIGLPVRFGARVLFYRKDHYKQLGLSLPKTADEYLNNARKLTRDLDGDGKPDVYGSAILHHLDLKNLHKQYFRKINHILSDGGKAIFIEPISVYKTLSLLRSFIPIKSEVSPDERQLYARS